MNFFKLYIGDYQRDTAHLSVTEHGAYLLMLQHYYATEKPLPVGKALHRMLRAQDKAERSAIDAVAAQFWRETPDGLLNDRADAEITKARAQAETNRTIAQEREARRRGQRGEHEASTNRSTNVEPNQTPKPEPKPEPAIAETHTEDLGGRGVCDPRSDDPGGQTPTPAGRLCRALRQAGIAAVNPGHALLRELQQAGATDAEFLGMAPQAMTKNRPFDWLLGAVKGQRESAAQTAAGLHKGQMPNRQEALEARNRSVAERWAAGAA